jgi:hypothetical protein
MIGTSMATMATMERKPGAAAFGAVGLVVTLLMGGCWNGGNSSYHFGDVSVGQQLIDLQAALDQGAVEPPEYERLKAAIMDLSAGCRSDSG